MSASLAPFVLFVRLWTRTMRALIVDDDESSCQLLAKILTRASIDAEWTTDSHTGFAKALQYWYDLVVLDVQMPGLLGTDFAAGLKQHRPKVPSF